MKRYLTGRRLKQLSSTLLPVKEVSAFPVMTQEYLMKGGPAMESAIKKWGK